MSAHEPPQPPKTDDAYEIEHSLLEREETRDGTTVKICIYRGPDCSPRWILEVVDAEGGSTVWDDLFDTDQQALDAALQAIDEDGIDSFAESTRQNQARRNDWDLLCESLLLSEIGRALDGSPGMIGFCEAIGVFAAVATAPTPVRPGVWMDMVKGDHVFEDMVAVEGFSQGVIALYNEVLRSVSEHGAHCCPDPDDHAAVRRFCRGYLAIAADDPAWEADERAFVELLPMFALAGITSMDKVAELLPSARDDHAAWLQRARRELPSTVTALYDYWAEARLRSAEAAAAATRPVRRTSPKVGRNEPCPCGSGRKFKKCCAN
jgi:uncharacterized protein